MALVQVQAPYKDNYDYGVGVDLATGSPMGRVVGGDVQDISGVVGAGGATTSYDISRIHTTSELEKKLGINAEASYGCGAFAGVSARFDFAQSSKIQSSSLFLAITATVVLEVLSIDNPTLTPEAVAVTSRPTDFVDRYGNMFVRGIGRGGMFVAVIQINTTSSEDAKSVSAELEGAYGLFSASAKTKFEEVQKKYSSDIRITVYHEGGPIDLTMNDITDANQLYAMLQQWLKAFQDNPIKNAKPYYVTLAPTAIANGSPTAPNAAQIQHAQDILVLCAKERSMILDNLNLMEFISQNPSHYDFTAPTTPADIVKAFVDYQADLDLVAAAASQAINDSTKAVTPADYASREGKSYPRGKPPIPMPTPEKGMLDVFAAKGEALTNEDPLAVELRNREPAGPARRGFDIGMGAAEGQTLPGPGKQRIHDSLSPAEQEGYSTAVSFSLERNRNIEWAGKGAAIAQLDPVVAAARTARRSVFYWLGFDIATGIFGDASLGGAGHTSEGPGSGAIRDALSPDGQSGFRAAVDLYLVKKHKAA
jgi:hypothetical protein